MGNLYLFQKKKKEEEKIETSEQFELHCLENW